QQFPAHVFLMTATATSPAPAPQTPAAAHARTHGGQGANGASGDKAQRQAPADLFATLLALAGDAAPLDAAAQDPLAADAQNTQDAQDPNAPDDNPLAGLLLWQPPALDATHPDLARAGSADATLRTGAADADALASATPDTTA